MCVSGVMRQMRKCVPISSPDIEITFASTSESSVVSMCGACHTARWERKDTTSRTTSKSSIETYVYEEEEAGGGMRGNDGC